MAYSLLNVPAEILSNLLFRLDTVSFLLTISTCHYLFDFASAARDVIIHFLHRISGNKIGLASCSVSIARLFLTLRHRASLHLFGAGFMASCHDFQLCNRGGSATSSHLLPLPGINGTALVIKDCCSIRLYDILYCMTDQIAWPYLNCVGDVILVTYSMNTISVLYSWTTDGGERSHSIVPLFTFPCTAPYVSNSTSSNGQPQWQSISTTGDEPIYPLQRLYHLIHYTMDKSSPPKVFAIPVHKPDDGLIPIHMSVHNFLSCAIIWGKPVARRCSTDSADVVYYGSGCYPTGGQGHYATQTVITDKSCENNQCKGVAEATSFFDNGRRLKLYSRQSLVPPMITIAYVTTASDQRLQRNWPRIVNNLNLSSRSFRIESPFFGKHGIDGDSAVFVQLCLGAITVPDGREELCIMQNRKCSDDDSELIYHLDTMFYARSPSAVVACLRGWEKSTSATPALDQVCINSIGTRIAISIGHAILVWSLNPAVLCGPCKDEDTDSEDGLRLREVIPAIEHYYNIVHDEHLGDIVNLYPAKIHLGDAVAMKMRWMAHPWAIGQQENGTNSSVEAENKNRTAPAGFSNRAILNCPSSQRSDSEYNLIILTDKGFQLWDLGSWGQPRRTVSDYEV